MKVVADAIREGAEGFLSTQYGTVGRWSLVVAGALFFIYLIRPVGEGAHVSSFSLALLTVLGFLLGAACSGLAGWVGVWISVRCNLRVAGAAANNQAGLALKLAFCGGAVSSIISAAMCILGISLLYSLLYASFVLGGGMKVHVIPLLLVGYGFGASFVALFMQLGGGIYTKAADVGADMCGKIESNIPEDDHRNPAVIADLVGDNVGDCAGSMADVFESIAAEIIGTMIHAGVIMKHVGAADMEGYMFFPLVVHAFDLIVSTIGIVIVRTAEERECQQLFAAAPSPHAISGDQPLQVMRRAYVVSAALALGSYFFITWSMLSTSAAPWAWWKFFLCGLLGIFSAYALIFITQYYTDYENPPVKGIARASTTGHGTNIIAGLAVGYESTAGPAVVIALTLLLSFHLGESSGLGSGSGLFGTAAATMGMLGTAVFILAMNNFGPIADNAGGIVEMSEQPENVRMVTDKLDAVGNVTKAATKGYAVGGSALATFILFRAYLDEVSEFSGHDFEVVNIAKVEVLVGGLLGIAMIFLFVGWAIDAVGKTAQEVVREVRRQFEIYPGILEGSQKPEYNTCVAIVTRAALKEMTRPALLALGTPVFIGFLFKFIGSYRGEPNLAPEVLACFMMFGSLTGLLVAVLLDNAGGAWDNAKKYIETGMHGGKGSDAHKAAVTGDTVGDPCKDTAGPALHVIITTMSTTIIVLGPLFLDRASALRH
ncbi:hypothetical protein GUITHDRAFT_156810 [Guillardia theta CCMP2712]|uniref:H(+)-exporting diphosphatase n=1 Tax=Guillardia theta (strain CCMP2712) TaxID=905079 RepID=L1K335_GUITC|nr:hypothetical protein GUITHDRAFT_156810 [Guillardia theta CCMP2712]EKX54855.1 hypothetical protein GUITHDRAFT_156810 [Guillardia theta CCMP2712]|eukprot:XP_005841835.1 hypothetical protein GUITHDRAFT_156810 [Guillardia theta CCMP2712]